MFEKLQEVEDRYDELIAKLGDPSIVSDLHEFQRIAKTHSDLTDIVSKWREYKDTRRQLADTEAMLHDKLDDELRELAQMELDDLRPKLAALEEDLRVMLLPKDPNDEKDVIVEIRAGTGGEEAALFAGDLLRMYTRYAERRGWKTDLLSSYPTGIGGYKEANLEIKGRGAYSSLKFEGGVHRVQRVPATESSGRIHTSAATVAVMPEAEEVDVQINQDDLEIDTFRSSSAGGQNVQKNETAVRITHRPSGIVVSCQDERSQFQNKERAMTMLRAHVLEREIQAQHETEAATRRSMVGSGDRSEKIRTYNFPQSRVTDHRINYTVYRMDSIMDGDIQEIVDRLNSADQAEKLQASAV
ncbi:MAG: peptide chain release factor 1 [Armatimonadota bacterium]|nr:peptide chain release factor 1 [Armatimonadota bacterium]